MNFKNFVCGMKEAFFKIGPLFIQIEEVSYINENQLLGVGHTDPSLKKFKVTFRYPKTKTKAGLGHYDDATMYVQAINLQDAKNIVTNWVRGKLEPDETTGKKVPKVNYLRDVKQRHMNLRTKQVANWKDFLELLNYVANTRGVTDPLSFFGDNEIRILLQKAHSTKNFDNQIQSLSVKEQNLLKKVYNYVLANKDNPDIVPVDVSKLLMSQPIPNRTYRSKKELLDRSMQFLGKRKLQQQNLPFNEPEPEKEEEFGSEIKDGWGYHSVFEPKSVDYEERVDKLSTITDVVNFAKKYGIDYKSLKQVKDHLYEEKDRFLRGRQQLWRDMNRYLKISPKNEIFRKSDYNDERLAERYNIHWDMFTESMMSGGIGFASIEYFPYYGRQEDTDDSFQYSEAANWLWNFYSQGMPKDDISPLEKWKKVLAELLDVRRFHYSVPFDHDIGKGQYVA